MNFKDTIKRAKTAILLDRVVTLGETTVLLRMIRPFVAQGNQAAIRLEQLIGKVRTDGIVTPEESQLLACELERLAATEVTLESFVRTLENYPEPGRTFRDVTGLTDTVEGFNLTLDLMVQALGDEFFDVVVSPSALGASLGAALAARTGKAFVPIARDGELPRRTLEEAYYRGNDRIALHIHADALELGERVVVVDGVLAAGNVAATAARLVERAGGVVARLLFPVELEGYRARELRLRKYPVSALIGYPGK